MHDTHKSHKTKQVTVRLPERLADDLSRAADAEANTVSAVVRRHLTTALARERGSERREVVTA